MGDKLVYTITMRISEFSSWGSAREQQRPSCHVLENLFVYRGSYTVIPNYYLTSLASLDSHNARYHLGYRLEPALLLTGRHRTAMAAKDRIPARGQNEANGPTRVICPNPCCSHDTRCTVLPRFPVAMRYSSGCAWKSRLFKH